ncbi:type 1 glutamine amidotransferase [Humibacter sp. BT305]|uniref:Protease n=1 Tax=Cnuibacter physcomitrellae TaxID=1619308 RepID=A0A1X9LRQ1_9MICO|nr:type 1 glutamine amidotransferase domain-containing protein [Cnuibacter physcomitrellae]ARJ06621.1 protease [Cnuibacter physcomitrellae]AXH34769.1 type 1 glutamine amidotransferase [Humibacter sp. BT305]MCS5498037.1 type 1 glutamine amidotransferase [Cnuibacter physcomitrellae]GGI38439.1 protease [Cnuibacter physcomitrellae]
MTDFAGRRILAIVTNYGVEQDELVVPVEHLRGEGAQVTIAAQKDEPVQTLVGDKDPGRSVDPTTTLAEVDPDDFELLLIPGGTLNADSLRLDDDAVAIVKSFAATGRPIAAICHGPWALVQADVVSGKTLTSYPSLATDIRNAHASSWVDEEVVLDRANGYTLITSRTPKDLDAFTGRIDEVLSSQSQHA